MSRLRYPFVRPGTLADPVEFNTLLSNFETASQAIDGDNIRKEGITSRHIAQGNTCTVFNDYATDTVGTPFSINSVSYTEIDTGTQARISGIGLSLVAGDVLRVHSSILTGVPTIGAPTLDNYTIKLYASNLLGTVNYNVGPEFVFSMQGHRDANSNPASVITWNRHVLNWEWVLDVPFSIDKVRILAKAESPANDLPVITWNLLVQVDRA